MCCCCCCCRSERCNDSQAESEETTNTAQTDHHRPCSRACGVRRKICTPGCQSEHVCVLDCSVMRPQSRRFLRCVPFPRRLLQTEQFRPSLFPFSDYLNSNTTFRAMYITNALVSPGGDASGCAVCLLWHFCTRGRQRWRDSSWAVRAASFGKHKCIERTFAALGVATPNPVISTWVDGGGRHRSG